MEINNNYLNGDINSTEISTLSSAVNLKALENVKTNDNSSSSFTLDIANSYKRSDFSNTLKDSLNQLSVNQQNLQEINTQRDILSSIQTDATSLIDAEDFEQVETVVQPQIESSIDQYNSIVANLEEDFSKYQENTDSKAYFDGILGAKPLRPSEILNAVADKQRLLDNMSNLIDQNTQKIESKALKTISDEIDKAAKSAPYEPIDFGKNISDFTSTNINSIVGSVVSAQANAVPANSPKLLA